MILPSLAEPTFPTQPEYEVAFATGPQGAAKTYVLRIRIPRILLEELGEPKRIVITGKPHEGYTFKPTKDRGEGVALNYKAAAGRYLVISVGFKQTKLTKMPRRLTTTRARIVDGTIRTGGMPKEWIDAAHTFIDVKKLPADQRAALEPAPAHHRLTANPSSGSAIRQPNGKDHHGPPPAPPTPPRDDGRPVESMPVSDIRSRLDAALRQAHALKAALEQRTGLSFRVSQEFRLILDTSDPTK